MTAVGPTEVQVDLGCKQAGYISAEELSADPSVKPEDVVKVGDEIGDLHHPCQRRGGLRYALQEASGRREGLGGYR